MSLVGQGSSRYCSGSIPFHFIYFNYNSETALLKVTKDILLASDSGFLSILLLLDLSAAFDTINHSILLQLSDIRITGSALS